MNVEFRPGFTIYRKNGISISWIAPHSGHSFLMPDSRDEETDTVASLCWMKRGGSLILADTPRVRDFGIDFNRASPSKKEALEYHMKYEHHELSSLLWLKYRDKYGWTAKDNNDFKNRLSIYRNFWKNANASQTVVLVHRMVSRLSNSSSLMDVTGFGISKKKIDAAVRKVNEKFSDIMEETKGDLREFILISAKERFHYMQSRLDMEHIFNNFYEQDLKFIGVRECEKNGFINAAENKLRSIKPEVTASKFFSGKL